MIRGRITGSAMACFDETGLRVAGRLHWMHSASTATDVLLTVHLRRGVQGMDAAGVLPAFTGVAVHDAWAPYDTYTQARHALCNAHALRELVYVVDTAPDPVAQLAQQAIDALGDIQRVSGQCHTDHAAGAAAPVTEPDRRPDHRRPDHRRPDHRRPDHRRPDHRLDAQLRRHQHLLRSALVLGKTATATRATPLERKHHALFTRLIDRREDYQRFTTDPAVPFDNNAAEQTIRMPKLRIKVSGCLRTLTGAQEFAAIRSYTATAVRHGQNMLDALVQAADHNPWTPAPAI